MGAEDYDRLAQHKWCAVKGRDTFYAQRGSNGRVVSMHREIMRAPKGVVCDHKNHNGLDNRKSNLRLCTSAQNQYNKRAKKGCPSINISKTISKNVQIKKAVSEKLMARWFVIRNTS